MPPGSQHSVNFRKTTAEKVKIQRKKKRGITLSVISSLILLNPHSGLGVQKWPVFGQRGQGLRGKAGPPLTVGSFSPVDLLQESAQDQLQME